MPFAGLEGVRRGCRAVILPRRSGVRPSRAWLGRVVDCFGRPLDGKGPLQAGPRLYPFRGEPPAAHKRNRVGEPLDTISVTELQERILVLDEERFTTDVPLQNEIRIVTVASDAQHELRCDKENRWHD